MNPCKWKLMLLMLCSLVSVAFLPTSAFSTTQYPAYAPRTLLLQLAKLVELGDVGGIEQMMYPINMRMPNNALWLTNVEVITAGVVQGLMERPAMPWRDNAFTQEALRTLIDNAQLFEVANSENIASLLRAFESRAIVDAEVGGDFVQAVKEGRVFVLSGRPPDKSCVIVIEEQGQYKLVLWKQIMVLAADLEAGGR